MATILGRASWVSRPGSNASVPLVLEVGACWYTDAAFCRAVQLHGPAIGATLGSVWAVAAVAVAVVLYRPVMPFDATARLLVWTVFLAPPLAYWGVIAPCVRCHDFVAVIAHEAGTRSGWRIPTKVVSASAAAAQTRCRVSRLCRCPLTRMHACAPHSTASRRAARA
jgi:hypothetical protein